MSKSEPSSPPMTAAILVIGDEVLRGEVVNGNAAVLGDRLFALGLETVEHAVVSDDPAAIRAALERLASQHGVIVVTGGLGPTEDDRTVDVVAAMLGGGRVVHQPSLDVLKARFERQSLRLTANNLRQAEIPAGATPLPNGAGLAPGFFVSLGVAVVFFLPGVPREMLRIFSDHVAFRVADLMRQRGVRLPTTRIFHVYGMGESQVDDRLAGLLDGLADVSLHFHTALTENHVRVVVRNRPPDVAAAVLERLDREIQARLGPALYGRDNETFVGTVQSTFRSARKTLALAESCTGGYAGELVTAEPGASEFFLGGVVSYANAVKTAVLGVNPATLQRHGAVSEPCAAEMAAGAKRLLGADVAVAITGIAGSAVDGPGYPQAVDNFQADAQQKVRQEVRHHGQADTQTDGKPVGTVCFAVCQGDDAHTGIYTETRLFSGGRERIRRAAAYFALDLGRRAVLGIIPPQKSLQP